MRSPARSISRLPRSAELGEIIRELIETALEQCPELQHTAEDILAGAEEVRPLPSEMMDRLSSALRKILEPSDPLPEPSTRAKTPIHAWAMAGWAEYSDDPDARTLAEWLGPLGFDEAIQSNGVFPISSGSRADIPTEAELTREAQGWMNWPSAIEEADELEKLILKAESQGFCHLVEDETELRNEIGAFILNKLGVVVKYKGDVKKARIIWDLRESRVNQKCNQGERVVLPRLLDVVSDLKALIAQGSQPVLAAVDIQDAFHNIPAGPDKRYTVAAAQIGGRQVFVVYDVLVFGSGSSPTLWGRYAALLGRTIQAVVPEIRTQVYVDDPIFAIPNDAPGMAEHLLTCVLVWTALLGYPVKLSKAKAGLSVEWIGAQISVGPEGDVQVRIPPEKVDALLATCLEFLENTVVGIKQLRAFAGGMSFVAGLVPLLRPFLKPLWAALASGSASDGGAKGRGKSSFTRRTAGKLIHTSRIRTALRWIAALLRGEHGEMVRTFKSNVQPSSLSIATDACPWGMGGILYDGHEPVRWFATPLTTELLDRFGAKAGDPRFNTLWEALALLLACRLWLPSAGSGLQCRINSDNVGALRLLLRLTTKSGHMAEVARELALDLASGNYFIGELEHIAGITNVAPDALSRLWAPEPEPFPSIGKAVQDKVPDLGPSFWRGG